MANVDAQPLGRGNQDSHDHEEGTEQRDERGQRP
jgi:hypothetical protein